MDDNQRNSLQILLNDAVYYLTLIIGRFSAATGVILDRDVAYRAAELNRVANHLRAEIGSLTPENSDVAVARINVFTDTLFEFAEFAFERLHPINYQVVAHAVSSEESIGQGFGGSLGQMASTTDFADSYRSRPVTSRFGSSVIPEHMRRPSRWVPYTVQRHRCSKCLSDDHDGRYCTRDRICFLCRANDHTSERCPQNRCVTCGEYGHGSIVCPRNVKVCFKCNREGHISRDCMHAVVCNRCRRPGHFARDCEARCYSCGQSYHRITNCPYTPCALCGSPTHAAPQCRHHR